VRVKYFYGYNIVAAGFAIQAVSIGALFAYGVFFREFQAEFGWSRATISGASSLAFLIMGAVGILAGRLNDRIGPRILIAVAGAALGIGHMLLSYMQAAWQLYLLYGLLVGVGYCTHDVITLSTIARWFVKRRGMMSGIVKVGTGCGQLFVPLIATALIAAYGWRSSCFCLAAAVPRILDAVCFCHHLRLCPRRLVYRHVAHGGGVVRHRLTRAAIWYCFVQRDAGGRHWPTDGR